MLGIEINPDAAELDRVSAWIGHIHWNRRHGFAAPSNPVLQALDTIECRDAVLPPEGTVAEGPKADVIGNMWNLAPACGGRLNVFAASSSHRKCRSIEYSPGCFRPSCRIISYR